MLIDTHAHIDFSQFDNDRDEVLSRSSAENIIIIHSGLGVSGIKKAIELTEKYNNIYTTLGLHPASCKLDFYKNKHLNNNSYTTLKLHPGEFFNNLIDETINEIRKNKDNKKVIGIGEVGLDYHWVKEKELRKIQQKSFEKFIQLSNEINLPLVIHSRNAEKDCIKILEKYNKEAILHCFSGTIELAQKAISFGCLISITTTFIRSQYRQKMVYELPLEKIVLETDAPYLSPFSNKRNEPINIKLTAQKIAEIKGVDFGTVADKTTKNVENFFNTYF
jgi:TatD DNase family protein